MGYWLTLIGTFRVLPYSERAVKVGGKAEMLPFIMIAVLALLAFLCISHVIPSLTRRAPQSRPTPSSSNPSAGSAAK
jgi:hypothetical protein